MVRRVRGKETRLESGLTLCNLHDGLEDAILKTLVSFTGPSRACPGSVNKYLRDDQLHNIVICTSLHHIHRIFSALSGTSVLGFPPAVVHHAPIRDHGQE